MPIPTRHLTDLSGLMSTASPRRKWRAISFHFIVVRQMPAAAWLRAAELYLSLQRSCRPVPEDLTAAAVVEEMLRDAGLTAQWEDDDLVLGRPGWTPPPPRTVAVQPGLFDG